MKSVPCSMYLHRILNKKRLKILLAVFLILNFILVVFLLFLNKEVILGLLPASTKERIKIIANKIQDIPYFFYNFLPVELPTYNLIIDEDKLAELNENLPEEGGLTDEYRDTKSAKFIFNSEEYGVKVRYRGTGEVHWKNEKKSWKINFSQDDLFNGMKSIDLVIPEDRDFVIEALNAYRAKKLNLLSPFVGFSILKVNGKDMGIYLTYEHWGKDFLERNNLSDGANFYSDAPAVNIFEQVVFWGKYNTDSISKIDNYAEMDLLLNFINNASDEEFYKNIFNLVDEENFYNWQIHSVLAESTHQENEHNCRLYFNNAIGKFQFIPWDVLNNGIAEGDPETNYMINAIGYNVLVKRILKNDKFLQKRNESLWNYVKNEENLNDDLKEFDETVKKTKIAFYSDTVKACSNYFFDTRIKQIRENTINTFNETREYLSHSDVNVNVHMNFYKSFYVENDSSTLLAFDINMKSFSPLTLTDFQVNEIFPEIKSNYSLYYDVNKNNLMDGGDLYLGEIVFNENSKIFDIPGLDFTIYPQMQPMENKLSKYMERMIPILTTHRFFVRSGARITSPIEETKINLTIKNYFTGDMVFDSIKKDTTGKMTYIDDKTFSYFDRISESVDKFISRYPIFQKITNDKIALYGGAYFVNEDIIVPKGLELQIMPSAILYFKKDVSFVSYGFIKAVGTKNAPIKILALNPLEPRGTFAVVGAKKNKSEFKYVIFENGGEAYINGVFFSGTLALHQSDVEIENCEFRYAKSDDGLNVKYANAVVKNSLFEKNSFDALDFDYVTGEISGNQFFANGNDGIDISGSDIEIKNNIIKNSGDKGISVGERAKPKIVGNEISGCVMGVISKDGSVAELFNNKIMENGVGLSAYLKKPLYAIGGRIISNNTTLLNNKKDTEADDLSVIEFIE